MSSNWESSIRRVIDSVSTRPRPRSYHWGGRSSYFARIAFFGVFGIRLLSPLQWIKFAYRERTGHSTTNVRPDFPAALSELYFLVVLLGVSGALVGHYSHLEVPGPLRSIGLAVGALLLLESVTWVLYYLLLRSLIEGSYTIYHPAEYLLTLPVVVATQAFLIALLTGHSLTRVVAALTGSPNPTRPWQVAVTVLGLVYLTVALSVLLSSHPGIRTRMAQTLLIIGAGEVTATRILPALAELGVERTDVIVASLGPVPPDSEHRIAGAARVIEYQTEDELMKEVVSQQLPTIIASPTGAHFRQLIRAAETGERFAVEKPIVGAAAERSVLRRNSTLMKNGFALSYYRLEKALPLTYFLQPLPVYRKYLVSEPETLLDGIELQFLRDALGAMTSIEVRLLEGPDRSPRGESRNWTERPATLRPFVETCIHPLAIVRALVSSASINWKEAAMGRYSPRQQQVGEPIAPTFLRAHGTAGGADILMIVGKHISVSNAGSRSRLATIRYQRGTLDADFDKKSLAISLGTEPTGVIRVADDYGCTNYKVQMDLFRRFVLGGHGQVRYDDLEDQLDALDWWDELCEWVEQQKIEAFEYDDSFDPHSASLPQARPSAP